MTGVLLPPLASRTGCSRLHVRQVRERGSKVLVMFCLHVSVFRVPIKQELNPFSGCVSKLLRCEGAMIVFPPPFLLIHQNDCC